LNHNSVYLMKVIVLANQDWGITAIEIFRKLDIEILKVFTHPVTMDPNDTVWYNSVKKKCEEYKISVSERTTLQNEDIERIEEMKPDVLFSINWRRLISKKLINIPKHGCINIHPSLLPKYRGISPLNWAVLNGEKETGVTVHYIDESADTGDIIIQKKIPILFEDTTADIYQKALNIYPELLTETIEMIRNGCVKPINQKTLEAGFFVSKRFPNDGKIFWNFDRLKIYNLIRGLCDPYPNAFFIYNGETFHVKEAKLSEIDFRGPPGRVCAINDKEMVVTCGTDHSRNQGLTITKIVLAPQHTFSFLPENEINIKEKFTKLWINLQ